MYETHINLGICGQFARFTYKHLRIQNKAENPMEKRQSGVWLMFLPLVHAHFLVLFLQFLRFYSNRENIIKTISSQYNGQEKNVTSMEKK